MGRHLLVTNDFPPKLGGIQQYLWELWRRLDPERFEVHTTPYPDDAAFDAEQDYRIVRSKEPVLLPYPWLAKRLNAAAQNFAADLVVIDPAVPLGIIGPFLDRPYAVVLHGAEVTVPGRLPIARQNLARVLDGAVGVIAAGEYSLAEAERAVGRKLRHVVVPPGVDVDRYRPLHAFERAEVRERFGIAEDAPFIFSVSRLVPRKGMDTLIAAASRLRQDFPNIAVCIAGDGRDSSRLQRRIDALGAPVRLLGRISEDDKAGLLGAADVFAMVCRNRWGGLEQEGFGIVFVEAAAAGTPQLAGGSGGAPEAVAHGESGFVTSANASVGEVTETLRRMLDGSTDLNAMSTISRSRAVNTFSYDGLAARLQATLDDWCTL